MNLFLTLYLALLPFSFALPVFSGIDLPLARLAAVMLSLGFLAWGLGRRRLFLALSFPSFFLTAFLLTATLSLFWSANETWALRKILFLWSFLPLFFVSAAVLREKNSERILKGLIFGGFAAALAGILQFLLQFPVGVEKLFRVWLTNILPFFLGGNFGEAVAAYPSLLVNAGSTTLMRASAFFPDPHIFAFYMGMLAPLALAMGLGRSGFQQKIFMAVGAVLVTADLLSFSRGGYLGLLLGGLFFFLFFFSSRPFARKKSHPLVLLGVGAVCLLVFFSPVGERLVSSFSPTDGSSLERLRLWEEAGGHIAERPLFGVGLGNYPLVVKPSAALREPIYAHNLFLDIAVEVGLVGLFFFLGFLGAVFGKLWKEWRRGKNILALGVMTSLVVFLGHSFFEAPIFSVHILPLLLFIAALGMMLPEFRKQNPPLCPTEA